MKHFFISMTRKLGKKAAPAGKKLLVGLLITWIATVVIYWFNLENKLLYYVARPLLNRHYDTMPRDRRI